MLLVNKKCNGCNKIAKTLKGWCSQRCYLKNQRLNGGNKGWFKIGNTFSTEWLNENSIRVKKWHKDNPEKSAQLIKNMNTIEANKKKSHKGKLHPRWIKDRTKLKGNRCMYEEREFFKKILKERNFICELTKEKGGPLSVHHIDSVHLFPDKKFNKDNVIVIKKDIHLDFHRKYGFQWATKFKWNLYLLENNYVR